MTFELQHFIMWRWVLLCDYCSCFYICRRPLKFDRLSMSAYHRHFSQVSLPFSEFVHHHNCPLSLSNHPGGRCSDLCQHTTSVTVLHIFELHDMSMGHARLVCTHFYFFTPCERFGSYRFPSPPNGSLLELPTMLFLTKVLSVEETLMYFGYTYAPNLTHQGASVITRISSANGYRNPTSSKHPLVHSWTKNAFPKGPKLYNQL
jgi:hypothetical protein